MDGESVGSSDVGVRSGECVAVGVHVGVAAGDGVSVDSGVGVAVGVHVGGGTTVKTGVSEGIEKGALDGVREGANANGCASVGYASGDGVSASRPHPRTNIKAIGKTNHHLIFTTRSKNKRTNTSTLTFSCILSRDALKDQFLTGF